MRPGNIILNEGRLRVALKVTNDGDRPIQVGSHYHFIETNPHLRFDRELSYGKRLDIPAGTAVRFEPGESKVVKLVDIAGNQIIKGGNGLASGEVDKSKLPDILKRIIDRGFKHEPQSDSMMTPEPCVISRERYVEKVYRRIESFINSIHYR